MKIDVWCSRVPYVDHIEPVWNALPDESRGTFYVPRRLMPYVKSLGIDAVEQSRRARLGLVIILSRSELRRLPSHRRIVFMEHGVGASYNGGSHLPERSDIVAVLTTEAQAESHRALYGERVEIVGCPKLDAWYGWKQEPHPRPVVAFSHHWDQKNPPEARSSWPWDADAIEAIAASGEYKMIGHKHPSDKRDIARWCDDRGIEFVADWRDVMRRADLYVCDNSSTMYEFAATNRPVVCLSPPWYRRDVEHGMRFWSHMPGINCSDTGDLARCIRIALRDSKTQQAKRTRAVKAAYGLADGQSTERAVHAILCARTSVY